MAIKNAAKKVNQNQKSQALNRLLKNCRQREIKEIWFLFLFLAIWIFKIEQYFGKQKKLSTFAENNYVYGKSIRYFKRNICSL